MVAGALLGASCRPVGLCHELTDLLPARVARDAATLHRGLPQESDSARARCRWRTRRRRNSARARGGSQDHESRPNRGSCVSFCPVPRGRAWARTHDKDLTIAWLDQVGATKSVMMQYRTPVLAGPDRVAGGLDPVEAIAARRRRRARCTAELHSASGLARSLSTRRTMRHCDRIPSTTMGITSSGNHDLGAPLRTAAPTPGSLAGCI
jgi:hypothetical protein